MSSREIITIQCGHYSNFVGTHWWNLQESAFCYDESSKLPKEISTDCMFREGLTLKGEQTYTPRLLALDLSGSLRTLKKEGDLYDNPSQQQPEHSAWHGPVETHTVEPPKRNEFLADLQQLDSGEMEVPDMESKVYKLDSDVLVWSDFLRIHLHPKSLLMVPSIFHGSDSSFQTYPAGQGVWDRQFKESFEDRLHFFLEECDSLQGFHLLVDGDDGFGALGSCLAQELAEEFSQKGLLSIITSPKTRSLDQTDSFHSTLLNHAMSLDDLCAHSSLVCPLSHLVNPWRSHAHTCLRPLPSVHYEPTLPYHTAGLLATALETASLIYRVQQPPLSLSSMADTLTRMGRKVCSMGLCLPLSLPAESSFLCELDHTPLHLRLCPLTPFCEVADKRWSQCISVRGLPTTYPLCSPKDPRYSYCQHHASLALSSHLSQHFPASSTSTHFTVIHQPLTLGNPFPPILPDHYYKSRKVSSSASFLSQSGVGDLLSGLSSELKKLDVRNLPVYASTCLDCDSYSELKDRLVAMAECYRTKPNLDDTSDSD